MFKIVSYGVIGVVMLALVYEGVTAVAGFYRAGAPNLSVTAADLLEECGYDRFEGVLRGAPGVGCADLIRESLRAANTRHNLEAVANGHGRGRVCVADLLKLSDGALADTYAGWVRRTEDAVRDIWSAEILINLVVINEHNCQSGNSGTDSTAPGA